MKHPSKAQNFQFLLNFNFSKLNAMRNYQEEINVICVTQELQIMADKYEALLKTYRQQTTRWPPQAVGVSGVVHKTAGYRWDCWAPIDSDRLFYYCTHTHWKRQPFPVARSERKHCANAYGMDSCNSSFTMKSCTCAPIAFLARIISWFVDSTFFYTLR